MKAIIAVVLAFASALGVAQIPTYRVTIISPPSGYPASAAGGINNLNHVAGSFFNNNAGTSEAFIYRNGVSTILPSPGSEYIGAWATAINDSDSVTGEAAIPSNSEGSGGVGWWFYSNATMIDEGGGGHDEEAEPLAISNGGLVAGYTYLLSITYYNPWIYNTVTQQYSQPGLIPAGISPSNEVVGWIQYESYPQVIYHAGLYTGTATIDLGQSQPSVSTVATAMNAAGTIIGTVSGSNYQDAAQFTGIAIRDLGRPSGYNYMLPVAINSSGNFIANASVNEYPQDGVAVISLGGTYYLLNDLADSSLGTWSLVECAGINDNGYIACNATRGQIQYAALLSPYFVDAPTSYIIDVGAYTSGNGGSLAHIDGNDLVVNSAIGPAIPLPQVKIEIDGTATNQTIGDLRLNLTAETSAANLQQSVAFWDFQAGQWVSIGSQGSTTQLSTQVAIGSNPARFVQSGTKAVRALVTWQPTPAALSLPSWTASIDQAVWNDSP